MKRLISFVLAGAFGGLIALGGAWLLSPNKQRTATETTAPARAINFSQGESDPERIGARSDASTATTSPRPLQ